MEPKKFGGRGARARRQKVGRLAFWCTACIDVSHSYSLTDKSLAGVLVAFLWLRLLCMDGGFWLWK